MNTTLKVFTGAAVVGLLLWGYKVARDAFAEFAYKIVGYGVPLFNTATLQLSVPVQIRFNNPTPLAITADEILINVFMVKGTELIYLAELYEHNVTLPPGQSVKEVTPHMNLAGLLNSLTDTVQTVIRERQITLRTEIMAVYQGIGLPTHSATNTFRI
jgi:hypothetical protein